MNLVTGATGIVGSHVVLNLLQNNQSVVACRQKNSDLNKVKTLFSYYTSDYEALFQKITWVELDVQDVFSIELALNTIKNVYHCAGFVSFNRNDRKKLKQINEIGTKNMVNVCLDKGISAFCHVSSLSTINNLDYTLPLNEQVFWKTSGRESDYAISKYLAEREVWRGIEEGLPAVIVNPGVILSPGFREQSSSRLFDTCYKGNPFYTSGTTAYISADDTAKQMIALMEAKRFANRYILIENNYSYKTILSLIQGGFHKRSPRILAGPVLLNLAWMLDSIWCFIRGKAPSITRSVINSVQNQQVYSNQKLRTELPLSMQPVPEVIQKICAIYFKELQ